MKTLFIIRHSKSSWKNANLSDHERPLNKRGNIDAKLISNYLSSVVRNIDFLHCSSSKRTRETAVYFLEKININKQNYDDQLYHVSSEDLLQVIRAYDNTLSSAMIIAHNPGLTNFVNLLTDLNDLDDALKHYEQAYELNPEADYMQGNILHTKWESITEIISIRS